MGFFLSCTVIIMLIALIGSHGTGKTTICSALHKRLGKGWSVFADSYRKQARLLGYKRPREIITSEPDKAIGITTITGVALGALHHWKTQLRKNGIIDLGPPAILAYHRYWMKICDTPVSPYLLKLCRYLSDQVDLYIYLPVNTIPLVSDGMRSNDPIFQQDIDQWIQGNLDELAIPKTKVFIPQQNSVEARLAEIMQKLNQ